eukprot:CAMPEP_0194074806 /NCGR_PEP_ID=MMETSP0149-20130528/1871_1 /TAXON_ID=122233 /ORGANISM="Chaetoceros debilis, Strain MM31A-1" /LENGTH=35 /DNA_ID= /DNA_START= /DNA_END= /DNA_ORIENTATION=
MNTETIQLLEGPAFQWSTCTDNWSEKFKRLEEFHR